MDFRCARGTVHTYWHLSQERYSSSAYHGTSIVWIVSEPHFGHVGRLPGGAPPGIPRRIICECFYERRVDGQMPRQRKASALTDISVSCRRHRPVLVRSLYAAEQTSQLPTDCHRRSSPRVLPAARRIRRARDDACWLRQFSDRRSGGPGVSPAALADARARDTGHYVLVRNSKLITEN